MNQGNGARGGPSFHLFVYGTLRTDGEAAELLSACELVERAEVRGTLYDIDGAYPALVLAGHGKVGGEIWRCPAELLPELDRYEGVETGLFRRIGLQIGERACWTYVAGPKLAPRLSPERRLEAGRR